MSNTSAPDGFVVALADLYIPGSAVKAHNKGALVPVVNVEHNGWSDLVAKPDTKAANEAALKA